MLDGKEITLSYIKGDMRENARGCIRESLNGSQYMQISIEKPAEQVRRM